MQPTTTAGASTRRSCNGLGGASTRLGSVRINQKGHKRSEKPVCNEAPVWAACRLRRYRSGYGPRSGCRLRGIYGCRPRDIHGCRLRGAYRCRRGIQDCRLHGVQDAVVWRLRRPGASDQRLFRHERQFRGRLDGVAIVLAGRVLPAVRHRLVVPVRCRDGSRLPPDLPLSGGDDSDGRRDPGIVHVRANLDEAQQRHPGSRWKRRSRS